MLVMVDERSSTEGIVSLSDILQALVLSQSLTCKEEVGVGLSGARLKAPETPETPIKS